MQGQLFAIEIDLENDPTLARFDLISDAFVKSPDLQGLALLSNTQLSESIWQKIASRLAPIVSAIPLKQLVITLAPFGEAQNLSPLLALPFCQGLENLTIDGPLTPESIATIKALLSPMLSRLALPSAGLDTPSATAFIQALVTTNVNALNLNFNPIQVEASSAHYAQFCQALLDGPLQSLSLTSINDEAARWLAYYLSTITRPFHLTVSVQPELSEIGLQYLIDAIKASNKQLRVTKEDWGGFVELVPQAQEIDDLSKNRIPTLFTLVAQKLVGRPEAISQIPSVMLPDIQVACLPLYLSHNKALQNRQLRLASLAKHNISVSSDDYYSQVSHIEQDYEADLRKGLMSLKLG
ncbi:hypothetical protein [Candidatus Berkiella aquae]|uniref:Uncharacterized protein n=1 Tax=Candidatus Berkiella aquae TaxID=295108 RepID=A0A0Q9YDR1_9GAMM|nr:hypothetical protein [Candidatus Berkiella aquae]MCS5709928.1 hypothetical protein [Candidatus Berkiella aquae]